MLWAVVGLALAASPRISPAQTPTLTVPDTSGTVGTTLRLPVYLRGVASLSSFEFKLVYNGDRIRFSTFSTPLAEFAGAGVNALDDNGGVDTLIVSGFSFNDASLTPSEDTTLVLLEFTLASAGTTGITFFDFVEINACGVVPPTEPGDCLSAISGSVQVDTVVPVELTALGGVADGDAVVLWWRTASETNNAGFEIEQQVDGGFRPIALVAGHGTTLQPQRYQHRISALGPGRHTFRLRQIDYDGRATLYGPVQVTLQPRRAMHVSPAHPNPFNPTTELTLVVAQTQPVRVTAYDLLGRRVAQVFEGTVTAETPHRVTFDASGLPSGAYVLEIQGASYRATQYVVLSK